jgi:hypothetical protein
MTIAIYRRATGPLASAIYLTRRDQGGQIVRTMRARTRVAALSRATIRSKTVVKRFGFDTHGYQECDLIPDLWGGGLIVTEQRSGSMVDTYQVKTPYFTAGIVHNGRVVIEAAPILKWAVGKPWTEFMAIVKRKGWKVTYVGIESTAERGRVSSQKEL